MSKYKNLNCLIVDDYSTARYYIKNSLNEIGFTCNEANNGHEALAILLQNPMDLVIADINMPKKNGLKLLEDMHNDDVLNNIPVILTMIEPEELIISAAKELGMKDYLVKPFDVFTLSKVLDKVIQMEGGETL